VAAEDGSAVDPPQEDLEPRVGESEETRGEPPHLPHPQLRRQPPPRERPRDRAEHPEAPSAQTSHGGSGAEYDGESMAEGRMFLGASVSPPARRRRIRRTPARLASALS